MKIPPEMTADEFACVFLEFLESKGWCFGGGFREIADGYYVNRNGTKGKHVTEE